MPKQKKIEHVYIFPGCHEIDMQETALRNLKAVGQWMIFGSNRRNTPELFVAAKINTGPIKIGRFWWKKDSSLLASEKKWVYEETLHTSHMKSISIKANIFSGEKGLARLQALATVAGTAYGLELNLAKQVTPTNATPHPIILSPEQLPAQTGYGSFAGSPRTQRHTSAGGSFSSENEGSSLGTHYVDFNSP